MLKWTRRIALLLLALVVLVFLIAWWMLRGSLAQLEGESDLAGLSAPVSVQRDALGVVTIDAASESDAVRALGYVHAQERYFEMDLMRRSSAGELSELFGAVVVQVPGADGRLPSAAGLTALATLVHDNGGQVIAACDLARRPPVPSA